jgi:hypothetical protein
MNYSSKTGLSLLFIFILFSSVSFSEEVENSKGYYSFQIPQGWKKLDYDTVSVAYPVNGRGYYFRIDYLDFSSKEEANFKDIPKLFSGAYNFTLTETGDITGTSLESFAADKGLFINGHFSSPDGEINVEEIYLIKGKRVYRIYSVIPAMEYETLNPQVNMLMSSVKLQTIPDGVAASPSANPTKGPENLQGVEVITPEDGVNIALKDRGAYVEGARDDLGNISAMLDGESTSYSSFYGFTYALLNEQMIVVLDKCYLINKIDILFWDLARSYYQFKIETSVDKKNWELLIDRSYGEWYSWQYLSFPARPVKYIRINCSYNSDYSGNYKIVDLVAYLIKK